jgi:hypothetical protein
LCRAVVGSAPELQKKRKKRKRNEFIFPQPDFLFLRMRYAELYSITELPHGIVSYQKYQLGFTLDGLVMENVGILYC